uniref:fibulin-1-like n=1 Tax=Pristiophorus japonicus TaxID=55135 RepID=UPI00398E95ED
MVIQLNIHVWHVIECSPRGRSVWVPCILFGAHSHVNDQRHSSCCTDLLRGCLGSSVTSAPGTSGNTSTAREDIDECSLTASALCAYRCINTPGTFNCICPEEGYVLSPNGRNCTDLDECALGTHNCTSAETCFNVQGGYKCLSFECPANYRRVTQTRCERLACQDYIECQTMPQRISYYQLSFPTNIRVPANIFRISPSPVYAGDNILLGITGGNQGMHFSTRRLNNYTSFVYLQLPPRGPGDFLLDVEMTLIRHSTATKFIARIYVFITGPAL